MNYLYEIWVYDNKGKIYFIIINKIDLIIITYIIIKLYNY